MSLIDKNHVFNISSLESLLKNSTELINIAINLSKDMDLEISNLKRTMNRVPSEAYYSGVNSAISSINGKLEKNEFYECVSKLERIIGKLISNIPHYDKSSSEAISELNSATEQLRNVASNYKDLLGDGAFSENVETFLKSLEKVQEKNKEIIFKMDEKIKELLDNLKGLQEECVKYSKDPVNLSTGNFVFDKSDIIVLGSSPIIFQRVYNSIDDRNGDLGPDWTHNYEVNLAFEDSKIKLTFEDGHAEFFYKEKNKIVSPKAPLYKLEEIDNGYKLELEDKTQYLFNIDGKYTEKLSKDGEHIILTYANNKLVEIKSISGSLILSYNQEGKISSIIDHTGRKVTYGYTSDGRLKDVTNVLGNTLRYNYDNSGKIIEAINPKNIATVHNEFDSSNRTTKQVFPDGGVMSYEYDDENKQVILTEQNGNKIKYVRDEKYRNVKVVYEDGEEKFKYNDKNQRTTYVDKMGNMIRYKYDNKGNMIKVIDPMGNTTKFTYDENHNIISIKDCDNTEIKRVYDDYGRLLEARDQLDRKKEIKYNEKGKPVLIIQPDGSTLGISYDEKGNISEIVNPYGQKTIYLYDDLNRVIKTTNGNGFSTKYEYDKANKITKVINSEGQTRKYEYDATGMVTKVINFNGESTECRYNEINKPYELIDECGSVTTLEYDLMWNVTKVIEANGAETLYEFNKLNHLTSIKKPNDGIIQYEYDKNGNRTKIIDSNGLETIYKYDSLNRNVEINEADGAKTKLIYNIKGKVTNILDDLNNEQKFIYDVAGQITKKIDELGNATLYTYNKLGLIETIIDPNGRITKYTYLNGGLLESATLPSGQTTYYKYDNNGNVISKETANGYIIKYSYDSLDRIIKIENPQKGIKTYKYDAVDNVIETKDENGNITKYSYSPIGKLTKVEDALGGIVRYEYDEVGNVISMEKCSSIDELFDDVKNINDNNIENQRTLYKRDKAGNVIGIVDSLGREEKYEYDKNDNLINKVDKDGYLTRYIYNNVNKIETILYADGKKVEMAYNSLKQLVEVKDWLGTTTLDVDALGQPLKIVDHEGKTTSYEWGAMGERKNITYPSSKTVEYEYDNNLNFKSIIYNGKSINFEYDDLGNIIKKEFPNGITTSYTYNSFGKLQSLLNSDSDKVLDSYQYDYDLVGNKIRIERYRENIDKEKVVLKYEYDKLNRLTSIIKDDATVKEYEYDIFGNRIAENDGKAEKKYYYNDMNQLIRVNDGLNEKEYKYDKRGNIIKILNGETIESLYEFDSNNLLSKAINNNGSIAEYKYNGLQRRIGKSIYNKDAKIKDINYILDFSKIYNNIIGKEINGEVKNYIWSNDLVGLEENDNSEFYLTDELGTPLRAFDINGQITNSYGYDEFGRPQLNEGSKGDSFGFTGYEIDEESNLYYAQSRYYNAEIGRFVSEDGYTGLQDISEKINKYTYCLNNPLIYTDPQGFYTTEEGNIAHRALQAYFMSIYGIPRNGTYGKVEYYISSNIPRNKSDTGRADMVLVNMQKGVKVLEVYEIKPYASRITGIAQLQSYVTALRIQGNVAVQGTTFKIPPNFTLPYPPDPTKEIKYYQYPGDPGMIYYNIVNKKKQKDPVEIPVTAEDSVCEKNDVVETGAKVVVGVGAGYLIYRGIRMLPSLFPPLWWSIPANAVTP